MAALRLSPARSASARRPSIARRPSSRRSRYCASSTIRPRASRETSSTSSTIRVSRSTWRSITSYSSAASWGSPGLRRSRCRLLRIGARGLRSSCAEQSQQLVLAARRVGQPDGILAELALAARGLGQVAGDVGEAAELAARAAQRRDGHVGPEPRGVLAHPPALLVRMPRGRRGGQLPRHLAGLARFGRLQHRDGPAEDLVGGVTRKPLGAGVPGEDPTRRVEEDDAAVFHPLDQPSEASLVIARCPLGGRLPVPGRDPRFPLCGQGRQSVDAAGVVVSASSGLAGVIPRVDRGG